MTTPLPSLNALRAFEAVVRLTGVSRAAEALHVTHGAVSRQLRALEDELGLSLFHREGRSLVPTAAAAQLAEATGIAFAGISDAIARIRRAEAQAPLVLGCAASVLARWIIPRLPQLERDLPALQLHLSPQESMPDEGLSGLDAALVLHAPPWPDAWQVYDLAPERIGPVLANNHAAADLLRSNPPHSLLQQPLLHTASRPQAWPDWAQRMGLDPNLLQLGTGFDHLYYLLEAASAGLGIAIAPEPLVREDIANGRLIAPFGFVETRARWLLCCRRDWADSRLPDLADWLRHALQDPSLQASMPNTERTASAGEIDSRG